MLVTTVRSGITYSPTWQPAKATWYGKPTGAGPDNNGELLCHGGATFCTNWSVVRSNNLCRSIDPYSQVVLATSRTTTWPISTP
jgi:hypothetical protein